jgi:acyl transferase domain-containing protein
MTDSGTEAEYLKRSRLALADLAHSATLLSLRHKARQLSRRIEEIDATRASMVTNLEETNKEIKRLEDRGPPAAEHQRQPTKEEDKSFVSTGDEDSQAPSFPSTAGTDGTEGTDTPQ